MTGSDQAGRAGDERASGLARFGPSVVVIAVLLVAWEAYCRLGGISPVVLPSPTRVLSALWDFRADAAGHTVTTLTEAAIGFTVATLLAVGAAIAMDRVAAVRRALYPLLVGSQTIPIVAIAPLLVIWFGFGLAPKVIVIVLIVFFPIVVALLDGFASTPSEATDLMRTMGATDRQAFRMLRWPAALPALFTGLRIAVPYAVVGAVFGEYVGAERGLGIWMQVSENAFRTDLVFAAVLITAVVSIGLFLLVGLIERAVVPWRDPARR
jgi:ABC-type nitrate/sulfonate/bicarbonate transport system permease component